MRGRWGHSERVRRESEATPYSLDSCQCWGGSGSTGNTSWQAYGCSDGGSECGGCLRVVDLFRPIARLGSCAVGHSVFRIRIHAAVCRHRHAGQFSRIGRARRISRRSGSRRRSCSVSTFWHSGSHSELILSHRLLNQRQATRTDRDDGCSLMRCPPNPRSFFGSFRLARLAGCNR